MKNETGDILKKLINTVYPLPDRLYNLIAEQCRIEQWDKKHSLTESGKPDTLDYFLLDGIVHRYILAEKGEFITTDFYVGPSLVMPHFVRTADGKSIFSLQALTSITVAVIEVGILDALKEAHPEIRKWGQKVVEQKLKRNFVDEIRFRSNSAKERLEFLRREFPNLENLIPHTCIASYVGVTPVSFSRLRKEMARPS